MEKEQINLTDIEQDHRIKLTKTRGGWTKPKIEKQLKSISGKKSKLLYQKEISKYDTPESFEENLFYHGSSRIVCDLKPSIALKINENFGGGSGEQYYGISLSSDRNIASNFTGNSNTGYVAPVLIKRGAVIKEIPKIKDSSELDDIIIDLWNNGVDAVVIGDHTLTHSEKEIVILNPICIIIGESKFFNVLSKNKMPSFSKDEIKEQWINSSDNYKKIAIEDWEKSNISFHEKYGKYKDESSRWNSKQKKVYDFHKDNLLIHQEKQTEEIEVKKTKEKRKRKPRL